MIGFGEGISRFYRGYVKFDGRSSRAEYWWPFLMKAIVNIAMFVAMIALIVSAETNSVSSSSDSIPGAFIGILLAWLLFALINFLPSIALEVRRFHDLDQTGWLVLVFWLMNAFIGVTVFAQLIWFALRGTDGPNQYGPDPLGYDADLFG